MRRRPGIAGFDQHRSLQTQFRSLGKETQTAEREHLTQKLQEFRAALEEFALQHRNEIRQNPQFRAQFHKMCANVGVDPLASNKGFWTQLLGFGDFYYELAVQVVEAALAARVLNGGLMELGQLRETVQRRRGAAAAPISDDDLLRAIDSLKCLGGGWAVLDVGGKKLVRSVPAELNTDQNTILELATATGYVSLEGVMQERGWVRIRVVQALDTLLRDGFAMVDDGAPDGVRLYWLSAVAQPLVAAAHAAR